MRGRWLRRSLLLLLLAAGAEGRDLATLWLTTPAELEAFLEGGGREAPRAVWLTASQADLAGIGVLRQTSLSAGFRSTVTGEIGWQRTGTPSGLWAEHRLRGRLGRCGWPAALVWSRRTVTAAGAGWPGAWELALQPILDFKAGLRLTVRIPLAAEDRPWTSWGGESQAALDLRCTSARLTAALADGAGQQPSLRLQVWVRQGRLAAVGCGWDAATGETALLLALRRGGLLIRSRHGVHPLLGVEHVWQVGWVRSWAP